MRLVEIIITQDIHSRLLLKQYLLENSIIRFGRLNCLGLFDGCEDLFSLLSI